MKKETILTLCSTALAVLFFYAAIVKLIDYDHAQASMRKQVFSNSIADILTWLVPAAELITVLFLLYRPTQTLGLWTSLVLLILFTAYIVLAMRGFLGERPCSCGGILQRLSYPWHILLNLLFLAISILGLIYHHHPKRNPLAES